MKFWEWLGKKGQRLTLVSSILVILSGGGFSINKGIQWAKNYAHVPVVADSLIEEMTLMWEVLQTVHDDQKQLEQFNEMSWNLSMANTERYGRKDYFVTSVGDILAEGSAINVFVRQDHIGEHWAFFKICEGRECIHFLFPIRWSGVHDQFYFIDFQGEEHLLYER